MWIFTPDAFVSVVCRSDDVDYVMVRGRILGDVTRFMLPVAEVVETREGGTDYACRAMVRRVDFAAALAFHADRIDYSNFKDRVVSHERHDAYMDVWVAMNRFQALINPVRVVKGVRKFMQRRGVHV